MRFREFCEVAGYDGFDKIEQSKYEVYYLTGIDFNYVQPH